MLYLLDWRVAIGFALGQLPWLFAFAAAAFVKRGGPVTWEESRGLEPDYGRHTLATRDVELDDTQPTVRARVVSNTRGTRVTAIELTDEERAKLTVPKSAWDAYVEECRRRWR